MVRFRICQNLCKRKDTLKAENAKVCTMHFNDGSYKRDLEHEFLNLTPRKRRKTDAAPSLLLLTSTVLKPDDQCDKNVDNQGEDQVDFVTDNLNAELKKTKLKPLHIYCKRGARQQVRLAALVLSNTEAKVFTIHGQGKEARAKENTVEIINNWFDVVNVRQIYGKVKLRCALGINFEDQFIALDKMELSAGGDDDHPGAVGAMKRMIILDIGKNCETMQITGDILDITIGEESCSEFEFTFDIPHEVQVDFAINHQLDHFKKWNLNFQGLSYVSGFIAHKMKLIYPDLVKKTNWEVFDQKFKEFHLPLLDRHPKVIERFCQVLEDSFGDKYDKAILNLFAKTRTMIRIRYLNAQLEFNTGGSEKKEEKKQIGQFQV
ncbi:unnamed protein product [Lepeophtheirus salmonis]|uniref:(salmon louse) hypothetical protein n=1 Tax=Lepeophtheirus salmonis TaxID=72036 RepID=A0A7R8CYF7_LEPSM|nr:unnamed protein product [Lepeophtheirus salmonis]CAF2969162.1 unnamed protein product [Lepeophtheirus salmonis]